MFQAMDKIVEKTLLFDYYGELLTTHQQEIYEDVVFNDMSLSEAADCYGISRQGIHDLIRRCDKALSEYEEKLHMLARADKIRKKTETLLKSAGPEEERILKGILEDLES